MSTLSPPGHIAVAGPCQTYPPREQPGQERLAKVLFTTNGRDVGDLWLKSYWASASSQSKKFQYRPVTMCISEK